jgi:acetylornithine deacetylase/succinyl-diaminopimelate desuccinylase-like protein
VRVLTEGVHSGDGSGVVPSSFRILRSLLSRLEDENTGAIKLSGLHVEIPKHRIEQAKDTARILGSEIQDSFPFAANTRPVSDDLVELLLNRAWRPQLAVIGMDGYPLPENAGNVLLPYSTAQLSMRLPPTLNAKNAVRLMKSTLEDNPPYNAQIEFKGDGEGGWDAPALASWLEKSVARASAEAFGRPAAYMGEGGSIPFMGMLGEKFPQTQFVITGVLGPHSNAHGPNEFLHIPTGKNITTAIARILSDHFQR